MAVLGIPGSGKTVTLLRRVWIAARAGMRVVFVDCKGTDPGLAWQVTCAYRLANPGAIVGFWPTQPLDCWRGDPTAQADPEQLATDPQVLARVRGRYSAFFRSLSGKADGCWVWRTWTRPW
jgi:hypothetical protein